MDDIEQQVQIVRQEISNSAESCGRDATEITLVAVSKTKPAAAIAAAYDAGIRCFGENYLQEALEKQRQLHALPIEWHFIGAIQSNKTKDIAENFSWVASVDRQKILQRLHEQRPESLPPLQVLLQVNISGEAQKAGVAPEDVTALAAACAELPRLQLRGLMAIPEVAGEAQRQQDFLAMQQLFAGLQVSYPQVDTLSIGMSADFALAIACGSTQVRIGSKLFGARG